MNVFNVVCITIAIFAVLTAAFAIIWNREKTRRTLDTLDSMLDRAIDGSFTESTFDESVLSSLETKLNRYLSECAVSSRNLSIEKDKIKALISDISHQTKTPIANILLYSQLLSEHELPEECETCVKALSAQIGKLRFLIDALVKTSRLETGIITVSPRKASLQKLLDTASAQIKPEADVKNITVQIKSSAYTACFDLKWTTEAVYNIIDNAVKYSPAGGIIKIEAAAYELFCRIDITDNGIGIREEEHSKIFSRFYRSPSVNEQEGVGIGLFLAREIISAQGGYIKVRSELGKGAVFSIFLPKD
jgi:signal transduction histidine kinase